MKDVAMFCGKGGVGKTTCAAATALHHAREGMKTIIISTDPTPSLHDIFEIDIVKKPTRVTDGLYLDEIGADEVKEMWDRKFGAEVYQVFSSFVDIGYGEFVEFVASMLPGIRDEFMVDYIRELREARKYDRIVWDTAPAGQTLGLLRMPSIVSEHLKPAARIYASLKSTGGSRRSIQAVIKGWEELSNRDISFLQNEVEFNVVTIAEALAVRQLEDIFNEFRDYGLTVDSVIINQAVEAADSEFLRRKAEMQRGYISEIAARYDGKHRVIPLFPYEIKGLGRLEEVAGVLFRDG